jgi:ADP-ribosyl-[dinitrogen reductase] hydrolase
VRTSADSPIQIAELAIPGEPGLIGVTFCPGKTDPHAMTGAWHRDLATDLGAIRAWGALAVVTLLEDFEFALLRVAGLGDAVRRLGMEWYHLPIRDGSVPNAAFEEKWKTAGPKLRTILRGGGRIVVHCRGGLGRAGMIAACLLVEFGMQPDDAIAAVRRSRGPYAIETPEQEDYVRRCRPVPGDSLNA